VTERGFLSPSSIRGRRVVKPEENGGGNKPAGSEELRGGRWFSSSEKILRSLKSRGGRVYIGKERTAHSGELCSFQKEKNRPYLLCDRRYR